MPAVIASCGSTVGICRRFIDVVSLMVVTMTGAEPTAARTSTEPEPFAIGVSMVAVANGASEYGVDGSDGDAGAPAGWTTRRPAIANGYGLLICMLVLKRAL
jgi:hypothetical protein